MSELGRTLGLGEESEPAVRSATAGPGVTFGFGFGVHIVPLRSIMLVKCPGSNALCVLALAAIRDYNITGAQCLHGVLEELRE